MRHRRWVAGAVLFFVGLLLVGIVLAAELNPPKSFSLPLVAIDAQLNPDGSMRVVEHLTYDFTGSFTYGTRPIPVGSYRIEDVSVSENGQPLQFVGAPYNLQWYFSASDEQRTFDIAYTVEDAVVAGPDVTELYWKWVGEDHPTIDEVRVMLGVPPGPGRVRAWGHGPLNGTVAITPGSVRWRARSAPQGTYVEGRVAIPTERLPQLVPVGEPRLPTILAEERAWATAANAERREAAESAENERNARDALQVVAPMLAALAALAFFLIWRRWGREPPKPSDVGQYFRELPDDPPAVVDALMHWGSVRPSAFGATVLDLARRGYLTVTEIKVGRGILPDRIEYEFARTDQPEGDELIGFETATLEQLFASGPTVTQSELVKFSRAHQAESTARWSEFQTNVHQSLRARGYLRPKRALPFLLNIVIAIVVAVVAVAALSLRAWFGGGIALAWAAVQLSLTPLLRQRTPEGQRRYQEWLGVRNYLHDFSQLADAPAGHLVLWEAYLVYAVALGVSDQLARGLAARIPPEETAHFATWYVRGYDGNPAYGSMGSFSSGFATAAVGSFTPPSSGSGSGGGFSGGGGGGGGGGGIGAG